MNTKQQDKGTQSCPWLHVSTERLTNESGSSQSNERVFAVCRVVAILHRKNLTGSRALQKKCPLIKIKRKISLLARVIRHSVSQCVRVCVRVGGDAASASPCLAGSHLRKVLCVNCFLPFAVCFFLRSAQFSPHHSWKGLFFLIPFCFFSFTS